MSITVLARLFWLALLRLWLNIGLTMARLDDLKQCQAGRQNLRRVATMTSDAAI